MLKNKNVVVFLNGRFSKLSLPFKKFYVMKHAMLLAVCTCILAAGYAQQAPQQTPQQSTQQVTKKPTTKTKETNQAKQDRATKKQEISKAKSRLKTDKANHATGATKKADRKK